ncbi:MAG TPA: SWIM zinc finger family protein [Gemmataceae bacterium]|nr:SWIM zinc finger family protein [Gemmataceae bacterium]
MTSSLWLHLGSNSYRVERQDPGAGLVCWRLFKLMEDEDEKVDYIVRQAWDGACACDCPAFVFRQTGAGRPCKHITALREHGLLDNPAPELPPAVETIPALEPIP